MTCIRENRERETTAAKRDTAAGGGLEEQVLHPFNDETTTRCRLLSSFLVAAVAVVLSDET